MSDSIFGSMAGAIKTGALSLSNLIDAAEGLSLRNAGVGRFDIGLDGLCCLRNLLTNETTRLFDGVSDQPHGLGDQEVT